jgi:hypothetical protein
MRYILFALVGKEPELQKIASKFKKAEIRMLEQGIGIIPMTEDLYDEINNSETSDDVKPFAFLTSNIQGKILELITTGMIAYVEAEYHDGKGSQSGILWNNGIRIAFFANINRAINAILKTFGVSAEYGMDEFDTLGFDRHRDTSDWGEM